MKKTFALAAIFAASQFALAGSASAAQCADKSHVATQLSAKFGENLEYVGVLPNKNTVEVYSNGKSDRWTITVTVPHRGVSCLIATGTGRNAMQARLSSFTS
ncbi:MAG: hypothetical protein VXZ18_01175 [Pseudomonadota bacterium]|uniref:Uncharacterized protein n=1 Tax=Thalassococcus halodurans TaxID=373675 RepID=A0A1H6BVX8_9RHOB|nr:MULTISPECIES: hypothetical protein [Thalassococcus]MBO6867636.1 hypothetical protein [Thalassococcus sp.]MEC8579335.1 hypothetical protein [Pseudomonadota bacterium]SEG64849.1 hypothetical protein SAMN04488045_3817 [Thalassococcus halodurans]